jgi:PAS domain S-box-containing protein
MGTPAPRELALEAEIAHLREQLARLEEQFRINQAQLTESQRLAQVGSWERDVATGEVRWSDEMYRIYGLPTECQVDFQTFLARVHPKDLGIILESARRVLIETPLRVEFRIVRPDGEVRHIRSISEEIPNHEGVPVRITGTDQDITEHVQAMEALREVEGRLKNAARLARVGHWYLDLRTRKVWGSDEMYRIYGKRVDPVPNYEDTLQGVVPQDRERVTRWVNECVTEKKSRYIEYQVTLPSGELRTFSSVAEVSLDEDGVPMRLFGATQDITDVRLAQEKSLGRQKLESLGTLASGIAHDFNNILGAIMAQAELATAELAAGSRPDEALKQVREVASRGSEIVRQLMIYAGNEGDVLELTNVSKSIEGMLGLLKVTVSKHTTLLTDLDKNLPAVKARPAQLRQIVLNLVMNASDAIIVQEGIVRVSTSLVTVNSNSVIGTSEGLAAGEYVEIKVSDTGIGMSPETQDRVFDPFFTTKSVGRGLGLAVVHGIVKSLNGTIRVFSELNQGTAFHVLLPSVGRANSSNADTVARLDETPIPPPDATVLVVEDEYALRLAITKLLGKAGFRVLDVDNGSDAIELIRAKGNEIDVILLDMTIPGAPSDEVLASSVQMQPNIRVILTSAYSEEMAKDHLQTPQVRGFVRKPYQFDSIVKLLGRALSAGGRSQPSS